MEAATGPFVPGMVRRDRDPVGSVVATAVGVEAGGPEESSRRRSSAAEIEVDRSGGGSWFGIRVGAPTHTEATDGAGGYRIGSGITDF